MFVKMAARMCRNEYGVPDKILQTDLVPDWSAAEVTTGVSVLSVCFILLCRCLHVLFLTGVEVVYKFCRVIPVVRVSLNTASRRTSSQIMAWLLISKPL